MPGLRLHPDPHAALHRLGMRPDLPRDGLRVADVVPDRFPAVVRVLHPAVGPEGEPIRWREVADRLGVAFRPDVAFEAFAEEATGTTVQWAEKARGPGLPWIPERGSLDTASTTALARALERFAADPHACTFALWEGYASEAVILTRGVGPRRRRLPKLDVAPVLGRRHAVFQGPVEAAPSVGSEVLGRDQSPNLWWDPAWLVVTDVDLMSTFVGCDEACAQAILAEEGLEAVPIERDAWVSLRPRG